MRRFNRATVILMVVALETLPAAAQTAAQVETLQDIGNALRQQRRDEQALRAFELSFALAPEPRSVARVALAEMAIQRWLDAETHLTQALQAPQDPWIQEHRSQIDAALREVRTHLGMVRIRCDVEGARAWLGTTNLGRANGAVLRAPSGAQEIEVRAEGYRARRVAMNIPPGASVAEASVTLVPLSAADSSGATPTSPGASRSAGPWALIGVGSAAVIGYFVLDFVLRPAALDRLDTLCPYGVCSPSQYEAGRSYADDAATYGLLARVSLGVGVAAVTAGVVWAVARPSPNARPAVEPDVTVGPSVTSLSLRGRF